MVVASQTFQQFGSPDWLHETSVCTGAPFAPDIGGDALGLNSTDTNLDVPNLILSSGCRSPVIPTITPRRSASRCRIQLRFEATSGATL